MFPADLFLPVASVFLFTATVANALVLRQSNATTFTNPVTITSSLNNSRIGTAAGTVDIHLTLAPIPIISNANDGGFPSDNVRWAIDLLPNGNYEMFNVGFKGGITNGSVYTELPLPTESQEFVITAYNTDLYMIEAAGQGEVWTVGEQLGDQLYTAPFKGLSTQLFNITPVVDFL
ncbi:hypothetical protein NM688_g853 [Phlebia brevispora]|uniref:Uncharacterized protein n=1 Tax=Phlebia brevispora TaxID=194682 RepID=A0ACC1TCT8_9APHY|nr:hypothetical protein NM688_g853 [Phlebia brevispora]